MPQTLNLISESSLGQPAVLQIPPADRQFVPCGRLRYLMAAAQNGDPIAYRQFLHGASDHLDDYYTGMLVVSERKSVIESAILTMHEKRHTCDTRQSVRPWIEAIAEYRRKYPG